MNPTSQTNRGTAPLMVRQ